MKDALKRFLIAICICLFAYLGAWGGTSLLVSNGKSFTDLLETTPLTGPASTVINEARVQIEPLANGLMVYVLPEGAPPNVRIAVSRQGDRITATWDYSTTLGAALADRGKANLRKGDGYIYALSDPTPGIPVARDVKIGVSSGVLGKWFEDKFKLGLEAAGLEFEDDELKRMGDFAAYYVNQVFSVSTLQSRSAWVRLLAGPVQFVTFALALGAGALIVTGLKVRRASRVAPQIAELIPFSGFYGTLLGMAGALDVFGIADISDDTSKALNLGQIGGQLGLAISTTIWAIICFGIVMLLKALIDFVHPNEPAL